MKSLIVFLCIFCSSSTVKIKICECLGLPCKFIATPQNVDEILQHFSTCHFSLQNSVSRVCLCLEDFVTCDVNKSASWTPVFLQVNENHFMVVAKVNGNDQSLAILCLLLSGNQQNATNFNAKIRIPMPDSEVSMLNINCLLKFVTK